ncbi:MAG: N-6 DNA methylase [Clostridium sp.]|nr:N-6 DNA methylase [Clostridium sp.]
MSRKENNKNENLCGQFYDSLIHFLEYESNPFYRMDKTGIYDACFYVNVDGKEYPIVGIKRLIFIDEENIAKQHLLYWNRNDVPISILVLPGEIRVYNNFSRKKGKALLYKTQEISQISNCDMLKNLKASCIVTKLVWERLVELSGSGDRVDKQLLFNLKSTVVLACKNYGMKMENAYNFMSQCIFIKYLEDRDMLTQKAFVKWNVKTFTELLGKKNTQYIYEFFCLLKERFNGDLFSIKREEVPSDDNLTVFYNFFRGDDYLQDGYRQLRLFPYDFSVIPISLISNIYETFFSMDDKWKEKKKAAGAFYTPHYLADFMVHQCFADYMNSSKVPCVLDPACGSGVFLVSAFKQQIEVLKRSKKSLSADDLSKIMTEKIIGIDLNPNALRISCFSLYIALLDELTPKDILENQFRFPNLLGANLVQGSFFAQKTEKNIGKKTIDIVVGNPPWKSMPQSDHVPYCKRKGIPIADAQIAQAFICRVNDFVDGTAVVSFLITNAIFTNKHSKKFLDYLLSEFLLEQVTNLEAVKEQLFINATYPCSILTYRCQKKQDYNFIYYAFKTNLLFRLLNKFVYDKNEEMRISKSKLINREYIWTILTHGDDFDVACIENMKRFPKLEKSIKGKVDFVQGYITSSTGERCPEFDEYRGGSLKGCFSPYGLNYQSVPVMISQKLRFDRPRKLSIYTCADKVLVKRTYNEQCWGAAYVKEPVIFCNDFSTFNDYSGQNTELLRYIEGILNSKVFLYYCFYMTKVKAAKKPEVVKEDILRFPMPLYDPNMENIKEFVDLVMRMENLAAEGYQSGIFQQDTTEKEQLQKQLDDLVFKFYGFNEFDISVVEEGISRFDKDKGGMAEDTDYQVYSQCLCDYFNYYMKDYVKSAWESKIQVGDFYTRINFYFDVNGASEEKTADFLGLMGVEQINSQLLVQNRVMVYEKNGFQIIQTKEKRNWSLGQARKMAAQITREIMRAGGDYNGR